MPLHRRALSACLLALVATGVAAQPARSFSVLSELARIYGLQDRTELAVQTLELSLKQNPRASVELFRQLGR